MYATKKINRILIWMLVFFLTMPITPAHAVETLPIKKDAILNLEKIISKKQDVYDVLVKCSPIVLSTEGMSKKEIAQISQKELVSTLEKYKLEDKVESYKTFYIVNGVHVRTKDKEVLREIVKLSQVIDITENGKVTLIEPISDDENDRAVIFVPDESRIDWGVSMVHADKVWSDFGVEGEGVTVGIIDTGVNYHLPAIKKAFKGYNESTGAIQQGYYKDFIDGLSEPEQGSVNDHGTHVAGTIVGKEGEKLNVIGVAPKAKFISARAIDNNGGDVSDLLEAGEWMLEMKPDIINNSWGGSNDADKWFSEMAQSWRDAGIIPVFAAGNQMAGEDIPGYGSISNPGNLLNVFSVGAVDINKNLGTFSKKGPSAHDESGNIIKPDVVAPGVQVRSIDAKGRYVSWNGTSMATPHVVGVMALIKSANPNLSVDDIERIVRETAEPIKESAYGITPNMSYGYGLVDAYDAVAAAYGRERGSISGVITKDGSDQGPALAKILNEDEHYEGRDLTISVDIKDDVSIREATVFYKMKDEEEWQEISLELIDGSVADGRYEAVLDSKYFRSGVLELKTSIIDYSGQEVSSEKRITIKEGIVPVWSFNFDSIMSGFILEGDWKISEGKASGEPNMPDNQDGKYIGIDGGSSTFTKRVESRMYLPPIDVRNLEKGTYLSLSYNEYKGFTGISVARLEASVDGKNWELVHNVEQRPDITERNWEYNTYDLSKYAGNDSSLLLRMYFLGHDADDGCGWYIDNIHLDTGDSIAPSQVKNLMAEINQKGLFIKFKTNEETDIKDYVLERKEEGLDFTPIAVLNNKGADFINDGKNPTHFIVTHNDEDVQQGIKYTYRVAARDIYGNQGEWSEEISIINKPYEYLFSYDFEEGEEGFTRGVLSGNINDWERGTPIKPEKEFNFIEREIWNGIEKNTTQMWGMKMDGSYSKNQDSYLMMPKFQVPIEYDSYFYIDSFSTVSSIDLDSFVVEIRRDGENEWYTLFSKEEIQDMKSLHTWQTLRKSLAEYKGDEVWIRFHSSTGNGVVFDYSLGWYVDNICVGPWREVYSDSLGLDNEKTTALESEEIDKQWVSAMNSFSSIEIDENEQYKSRMKNANDNLTYTPKESVSKQDLKKDVENGIPLVAKIEVLETGKYTHSSDIDGSYNIEQILNLKDKPYTIKISAYGYETVIKKVDLNEEKHQNISFKMKPAEKTSFRLSILDENGQSLKGAKVRLVELEGIPYWESDEQGTVEGDFVFTGKYTLRIYKEGFISKEIPVDLFKDENEIGLIVLEKNTASENHKADYGFVVEETEGSYQTIHFVGSMKGNAVAFQSPYKGGILKAASLFLVNNKYYSGNHIQVAVLGYDDEGRLRELVPFREIENVIPNSWNRIDLTEFSIKRDKPIFIATRYEKKLEDSAGLYYDLKATDEAKAKSFIYDGAFNSTSILPAYGAFAIKTEWMYDINAAVNPQDAIEESGSNPDVGFVVPEQEGEFIFDEETATITGYTGTKTILIIPDKINGVKVKNIGDRAFDNTGKAIEVKLRKVVIPDGVETIGNYAFLNNNLGEIKLPNSLQSIGESAFKGQWKSGIEDKSLKVNIPPKVRVLEKSTFEDSGAPIRVVGGEGLLEIKEYVFQGSKDVTIEAPVLEKIGDKAFGYTKDEDFNYALIYTKEDTILKSRDGEYLINPALVTLNMIDARDHENVLKIGLKYGPNNPKNIKRNMSPDIFYKIGDSVTISPYEFNYENQLYTSIDHAVTITLKKDNSLTFYVYPKLPRFRMPIFKGDNNIVGFGIPNSKIEVEIGDVIYSATSDEEGYFVINIDKGIDKEKVSVRVNDKIIGDVITEEWNGEKFIIRNQKLLRFMGNDKNVILPVSADGEKAMIEVGELAFWGKDLTSVILPDKVEKIKSGAFMDTGLESFGWNLDDINRSSLRTIEEYAFKNNKIKKVILPELTHAIGNAAFENNDIDVLKLGKYTGHIGFAAFRNNKITHLYLPGALEEIRAEAFRNNLIEKIDLETNRTVRDVMDGLSDFPEYIFADNNLKEVNLPDYIKNVAENAFVGNNEEPVKIYTDVESVSEGIWHNVVRSDGRILKKEHKQEEKFVNSEMLNDSISEDIMIKSQEEILPTSNENIKNTNSDKVMKVINEDFKDIYEQYKGKIKSKIIKRSDYNHKFVTKQKFVTAEEQKSDGIVNEKTKDSSYLNQKNEIKSLNKAVVVNNNENRTNIKKESDNQIMIIKNGLDLRFVFVGIFTMGLAITLFSVFIIIKKKFKEE